MNAADRLIVALDFDSVAKAEDLTRALDGVASFYKIGMALFFLPGVDRLIDRLVEDGKRVFLDYKMYDIGETVRRGIQGVARRGVHFATVHGDPDIMRAAVDGRGDSPLKVFAISVLTSQTDQALAEMGYGKTVQDLIAIRARHAGQTGIDGLIASAADNPDELRRIAGRPDLLVTTPGIRLAEDSADDQARLATPDAAIANGADYLVVGRPITRAADPVAKARQIIAAMEQGAKLRQV